MVLYYMYGYERDTNNDWNDGWDLRDRVSYYTGFDSMRVGDLVRNTFNGAVGIVISEAEANGPHVVWRVMLSDGTIRKFQHYQMELISASR